MSTSRPLLLMLLLFAAIFTRLSSASDGPSSSCDTCEDVDIDDVDGEDSLNSDQMATLEAQMLKSIEESIPAEAKAAIARRDVLWFGLGAVNFELMPSKEQLEEMAQEVVVAEQENTASGSNDGDVSKQHHSLIILFGMGIIAMLILVGSFMVANAYFSRMALKNRARAAEGRFRGGGGGGHREESTFFRAPSSVTFSTD